MIIIHAQNSIYIAIEAFRQNALWRQMNHCRPSEGFQNSPNESPPFSEETNNLRRWLWRHADNEALLKLFSPSQYVGTSIIVGARKFETKLWVDWREWAAAFAWIA